MDDVIAEVGAALERLYTMADTVHALRRGDPELMFQDLVQLLEENASPEDVFGFFAIAVLRHRGYL